MTEDEDDEATRARRATTGGRRNELTNMRSRSWVFFWFRISNRRNRVLRSIAACDSDLGGGEMNV